MNLLRRRRPRYPDREITRDLLHKLREQGASDRLLLFAADAYARDARRWAAAFKHEVRHPGRTDAAS